MTTPRVTADARAMVGHELGRLEGVVSTQEFQRWAAAVDDLNPLYFDPEVAKNHGYRDVIMPPLYITHITTGVKQLGDLRPDGTQATMGGLQVPVEHTTRMAAAEEAEFYQPVYGGDTITAVSRLHDAVEKSGRSWPFVLVTWELTFQNQDDVVVAKTRSSLILR